MKLTAVHRKEIPMFSMFNHRRKRSVTAATTRRDRHRQNDASKLALEALEPRMLLSESASAQLSLVSTTGSGASTVYHYNLNVTDTGTTNIGTFWFAWVPGEDFLPSVPSSESSPSGWGSALTGSGNQTDGTAIQWIATSNAITPGHSLSGFAFSSADSPSTLAEHSPSHPASPTLTAFVYSAGPFSDAGFQLVVSQASTLASTTTALVSSQSTVSAGTSVTFTATVAPVTPTGTAPTGTVTFSQGGNALGTGTLQPNGTAQFSTSALPIGDDSITAAYGGDTNFSASTSPAVAETITTGTALTTTMLTTSAASIQAGTSVTLTAAVAAVNAGGPAPTGTVSFSQNGTVLGSVAVGSGGSAVFSTSALSSGSDAVTATYSGDGVYAASTSAPVAETVTTPPSFETTIARSSLPTALVAGSRATGAVTLDLANATAGSVKGKVTIQLFASVDGSIDGSAIMLASSVRAINLKTGRSMVEAVPVRIAAATLPAAGYTLIARVIDPSGNNNDSTSGPALTVAAPFVALSETLARTTIPATAVAGTRSRAFAVLQITNNGNITTPGSTTAALFASLSGVVDGNATQINSVTQHLRIRAGKSMLLTIPLKQIPAIAAGAYTILAQVTDPNGQVTSATAGTMTITTTTSQITTTAKSPITSIY
jgi:hypothetical protein